MTAGSPKRRRVLVVEDDDELVASYRRFFDDLHADEFAASYAADGEQALGVLQHESVDVVILDWGLPGISGASLAKALRAHAKTRSLGILMVTAKSAIGETVFALESGADDLLSKPFDWSVLLARIRSLARRSELTLERHLTKSFPGLELDLDADRLTVDGRVVRLTPKEMGLLKVFLSRPALLHPQSYLWQTVWGYEADGWERTLTVTISSLRGKLGPRWGLASRRIPPAATASRTSPEPPIPLYGATASFLLESTEGGAPLDAAGMICYYYQKIIVINKERL